MIVFWRIWLAGALALAACGSDSPSNPTPPDAASDGAADVDARVAADADVDVDPDTGAQANTLAIECRPRDQASTTFESCAKIDIGDPNRIELKCPETTGPGTVGVLQIDVRHLDRIVPGRAVLLGGSDPDVALSAVFATRDILIQDAPDAQDQVAGTMIFERLEPNGAITGHFVDARLPMFPSPLFFCALNGPFALP